MTMSPDNETPKRPRRKRAKAPSWNKSNWNKKLDRFPEAGLRAKWDTRIAELLEMGLSQQVARDRLIPEFEALLAKAKAERQLLGKAARTSDPALRQKIDSARESLPEDFDDTSLNIVAGVNMGRDLQWVYLHSSPTMVPDFSKAPSHGCRWLYALLTTDHPKFFDLWRRHVVETKVSDRGADTFTLLELIETLKKATADEPATILKMPNNGTA